jgi:hypothetical protein
MAENPAGLRVICAEMTPPFDMHALHLPVFNLHLTKSRLNDASRLCEMLHRNLTGHGTSRGTKWNRPGRKVYEKEYRCVIGPEA